MQRRATHSDHPFAAWTRLAMHTADMMFASMQVIGHRSLRIANAGHQPNARDRREFAAMGQEKITAAAKSANAMGLYLLALQQQMGARMITAGLAGARAMMSLAAAPTVSRTAQLARTVTDAAVTPWELPTQSAQLAARGLKPIRARARANAHRLAKTRRKAR